MAFGSERAKAVSVAFLLLIVSVIPAAAQVARSQFNGTVTDTGGAVLVGATIVATNVETNVESKATTTAAGVYIIPYLANGVYRIHISAQGFRPAVANNVTLRAAQTLTLDFQLEVEAITEDLVVTAASRSRPAPPKSDAMSRTRNIRRGPSRCPTASVRSSSSSSRACRAPSATPSRDRSTAGATTRTRS